jgi:glyoxylase-like metal-dependent hydrolase (beta-lactamase superfamily II)
MQTLVAAGTLAAIAPTAAQAAPAWRHFPAGEAGFLRAPVLLTGATEAVLIDGGFTLSDGHALAEAIRATGRRLTTVYVSQSDPDFYFGLAPIRAAFPEARIIAAPETVAAIQGNVAKKLEVWAPQLRDNGPASLADVVVPAPSDATALTVDGAAIEIVAAEGLPNRRYLWVPSLQAIFGGVMVFAGLHVWTADTATPALCAAWIRTLEAMAERNPRIVVAGHMAPGAATDASTIAFTRDYLLAFEQELAKAHGSTALIAAMQARYLDAGLPIALQIGAKVATGEMQWG